MFVVRGEKMRMREDEEGDRRRAPLVAYLGWSTEQVHVQVILADDITPLAHPAIRS